MKASSLLMYRITRFLLFLFVLLVFFLDMQSTTVFPLTLIQVHGKKELIDRSSYSGNCPFHATLELNRSFYLS